MKRRFLHTAVALLFLVLPSFALQESSPQAKPEDPVAKERAEKQKRLMEINKLQDDAQKKELLEKYIQENPEGPHLGMAYSSLLGTLSKIDPAKTVELADQILSKPQDPKEPYLRSNAYVYKFIAYQKQKNEEAIKALGQQILETQTEPGILMQSAGFDKENALKLYEKAIAEREKSESKDAFPRLSDLYSGYARVLSQRGQKDKAVEITSKAIELTKKSIAELEALPEKDPKRRQAQFFRRNLPRQYQSMAQLLSETGEGEKGLEYLAKAEELMGDSALEQRSSLEDTRARLFEAMGNSDKALDSYMRSFAFRMDLKTREKIKTLAEKAGKPADDYFMQARQLREAKGPPFKPFELKTVEGEVRSFNDLKGKVTLVNFFFPT